jgi:hypothetical protein
MTVAWQHAAALHPSTTERLVKELSDFAPPVIEQPVVRRRLDTPLPAPKQPKVDPSAKGDCPLDEARQMLAQGYNVAKVERLTGWGRGWFAAVDDEGYAKPTSERAAELLARLGETA